MFVPKKLIVPEVSRTRPEIARRVVLLPAPFAPSRPTASPSPTSILTSTAPGARRAADRPTVRTRRLHPVLRESRTRPTTRNPHLPQPHLALPQNLKRHSSYPI